MPFQWQISPPSTAPTPTAQALLADTADTELSMPGVEVRAGRAAAPAGAAAVTVLAVVAFAGAAVAAGAAPDSKRQAAIPLPASTRLGSRAEILRIAGTARGGRVRAAGSDGMVIAGMPA